MTKQEKRSKKFILIKILMVLLVIFVSLIVFITFFLFTERDRNVFSSEVKSINVAGSNRTYHVYEPKKLGSNPKIIFVFHGLGSNGLQMAYITGLHNSTDENTVVVYPDALKSSGSMLRAGWNSGYCCGSGWIDKNDDIGFVEKLADELSEKYKTSPGNMFATGFSNGGMFVQRIATEKPELFAGYVSVAGSAGTIDNNLQPKKAVNILHIHGAKDRIVPYIGGPGASDTSLIWLSTDQTVKKWSKVNNCGDSTERSTIDKTTTTYENCKSSLEYITYKENGHKWPDWRLFNVWNQQSQTSAFIINFFSSIK